MGMDVYGKKPTSKTGKYFRRNVWGWHPLWTYVENLHPEIAELVTHAHTNDGDGLNAEKSEELAKLLMDDYNRGIAKEYVRQRNEWLASLPFEPCKYCNETGIREGMEDRELEPDIAIIVGRTKGYCNACQGVGKEENWNTNYFLEEDDIKEFAEFLADCGGFEIC